MKHLIDWSRAKFLFLPFLYLALSNLSSIITFLISLTLGRTLDVGDFGLYYSLQAINPVLLILFSVLPLLVVKVLQQRSDLEARPLVIPADLGAVAISLPFTVFGVALLLVPLIHNMTKPADNLTILFFLMIIIPAGFSAFYSGILLAMRQNLFYLLKDVFLNASKLLLIWIFAKLLKLGTPGVYFSELLAFIGICVLSFLVTRNWLRYETFSYGVKSIAASYRRNIYDFLPILSLTFITCILGSIDVLYMKNNFSPYEAGTYSLYSVLSKIPYYFSSILITLGFAKFASNHARGVANASGIVKSSLFLLTLSVILSMFLLAFQNDVVSLLYGADKASNIPYFGLLVLHANLMSVLSFLSSTLIAINQYRSVFAGLWPMLVMPFVLFFVEGLSPEGLLRTMIATSGMMIASILIASRFLPSPTAIQPPCAQSLTD